MRYLLDTNIVSYFLRDASASLSQRILDSRPQDLAISTISAGELRFGLSKLPPSKRANSLALRMNHLFNSLSIEPLPVEAAMHYGVIRQQLEALGQPIGAMIYGLLPTLWHRTSPWSAITPANSKK